MLADAEAEPEHSRRGAEAETFALRAGGVVLSADLTRFLAPGDPEQGRVGRTGRIPLGYFDDSDATRRTFPQIDGQLVVISVSISTGISGPAGPY